MSEEQLRKPKVLSTMVEYRNPRFCVHHDELEWPNGHRGAYYVVERPSFVVVIVERDGEIALVEQYRYPIDQVTLELPKGVIEQGESPEQAAEREVREEVGCTFETLEPLATLACGIGVARQRCHVFLARGAKSFDETPSRDATEEDLRCSWFSVEAVRAKIRSAEIFDQDTLAAWGLYRSRFT